MTGVDADDEARRTWLREGLLLAGFLGLVGIAAWTVAAPELTDAAEAADGQSKSEGTADAGAGS